MWMKITGIAFLICAVCPAATIYSGSMSARRSSGGGDQISIRLDGETDAGNPFSIFYEDGAGLQSLSSLGSERCPRANRTYVPVFCTWNFTEIAPVITREDLRGQNRIVWDGVTYPFVVTQFERYSAIMSFVINTPAVSVLSTGPLMNLGLHIWVFPRAEADVSITLTIRDERLNRVAVQEVLRARASYAGSAQQNPPGGDYGFQIGYDFDNVPEPASWYTCGTGLLLALGLRFARSKG